MISVSITRVSLRGVWCPPSDFADWSVEITGEYQEDDHVLVVPASENFTSEETDAGPFEKESDQLEVLNEVYKMLWVRKYHERDTHVFDYGVARLADSKTETIV